MTRRPDGCGIQRVQSVGIGAGPDASVPTRTAQIEMRRGPGRVNALRAVEAATMAAANTCSTADSCGLNWGAEASELEAGRPAARIDSL